MRFHWITIFFLLNTERPHQQFFSIISKQMIFAIDEPLGRTPSKTTRNNQTTHLPAPLQDPTSSRSLPGGRASFSGKHNIGPTFLVRRFLNEISSPNFARMHKGCCNHPSPPRNSAHPAATPRPKISKFAHTHTHFRFVSWTEKLRLTEGLILNWKPKRANIGFDFLDWPPHQRLHRGTLWSNVLE